MYKNQLQELAQRSCFNLPCYTSTREGPDHAPKFKAYVRFLGEIFEAPSYFPTLRQAEHAAAEVALNKLNNLSSRGTSKSLAARVLDETGVYKNLLQETAHRAGLKLPVYTTVRSGPGHQPIFTCSVELASMSFTGESAKTKKQAEKNAAMAAWSALKRMPNLEPLYPKEIEGGEDQEQAVVVRVLSNFKPKEENTAMKQRDQIQRGRVASSPLTASGYRLHHQWRRFDDLLVPDSPQRGFSTLPSQSGHKILPSLPASSSDNRTTNFASLFPILPKKEEDVIGKLISNDPHCTLKPNQDFIRPRLSYETAFSLPYQRTQPTNSSFSPQLRSSLPRMMGSGGFHGIAPAVNVRSVVPVCAVPPSPARSEPKSSGVEKKEAGVEEISAATSKLSKLQTLCKLRFKEEAPDSQRTTSHWGHRSYATSCSNILPSQS